MAKEKLFGSEISFIGKQGNIMNCKRLHLVLYHEIKKVWYVFWWQLAFTWWASSIKDLEIDEEQVGIYYAHVVQYLKLVGSVTILCVCFLVYCLPFRLQHGRQLIEWMFNYDDSLLYEVSLLAI